jgi:DNA-binding NtrC family response regulator
MGVGVADVLIIDDDADCADALADLMRLEGHEVRVGYDGEQGMRLAQARTPDLALLDVEMPRLGGPAMAHGLLLHDMGLELIPVVFLSAVSNLRQVAAAVGTPYFLGKPYRLEQLLVLVRRALSERQPPHPPMTESRP